MKNQKTLLIFSPTIEDGGVEKNLFNISNFFSKKIANIFLITANTDKKKKFNERIKFLSPNNYFWIHKSRFLKTLVCIFLFINFFINNKKNITIFSFNSNLYAIIIGILFSCKVIVRSNTSPVSYSNNIIKKIIFRYVLRFADKIIVNSVAFRNQMKKEFNLNSKCIYNPLENINIINKKANEKVNFVFFRKKYLNIISVGRLVKQKDQLTLLKAMQLLKNDIKYRLLIIGDGEEEENLKNYIKINSLKNIKIISYKKNPYPYIKKSDLFILSSVSEGLPNALIEAMALKKFIISSDCLTGPREILLNETYGFLFKIKNYKQLATKIRKFYKYKNSLRTKSLLGFKSLERFNYNNKCNEYFNTIIKYL